MSTLILFRRQFLFGFRAVESFVYLVKSFHVLRTQVSNFYTGQCQITLTFLFPFNTEKTLKKTQNKLNLH